MVLHKLDDGRYLVEPWPASNRVPLSVPRDVSRIFELGKMVVEELQRPAFAAVLVRDEIVQSQSPGAVLIGSTVGLSVGWAVAMFGFSSSTGTDAASTFLVFVTFVQQFVNITLIVVVGTIAGAALGYFQVRRKHPQQPLEAENQSTVNHSN